MDKEQQSSKLAAFIEHPVTRKASKVAFYTITFFAGVTFGNKVGQKRALNDAGLPEAR